MKELIYFTQKNGSDKIPKNPNSKKGQTYSSQKIHFKVFIKSIVTSNPVPEEIDPFKIPIRKIKIKNLILLTKLSLLLPEDKPKFGLSNV